MSDIKSILDPLKISKEAETHITNLQMAFLALIVSGIPQGSKPLTPQQVISLITKTIPGELSKHAVQHAKSDLPGNRAVPGLPDASKLKTPNIPRGNATTNLMVARVLDYLLNEIIQEAAMSYEKDSRDTVTIDDFVSILDPEINLLIKLSSKSAHRDKTYQLPLQPLDGGKTISSLSGFNLMQIATAITGGKMSLSKSSCDLLHGVLVDVLQHLISIERGRFDKYTGKSSDEYVILGTLDKLAGIGEDVKIPQFVPYLLSRSERKKQHLKSTDIVSAAAIATVLEKTGKTTHPSVAVILSVLYEELAADVMDAAINIGGDLNPSSLVQGMKRSAPLTCFLPSSYKFPSTMEVAKPKSGSGPRFKVRSKSPSAPHHRSSSGPARGRSDMIRVCAGRKSKTNPYGISEVKQLLANAGLSTTGNKESLCTRAVDNGLIH